MLFIQTNVVIKSCRRNGMHPFKNSFSLVCIEVVVCTLTRCGKFAKVYFDQITRKRSILQYIKVLRQYRLKGPEYT